MFDSYHTHHYYFVPCCPPQPVGRAVLSFGVVRDAEGLPPRAPQHRRRITDEVTAVIELYTEQTLTLTLTPKDSRGRPAKVDGVPEWATDNSDLITLAPSDDGLTCQVTTNLMSGTARVQVLADADLGEGVRPLSGVAEFVIKSREAVTVELTPGTIVDLP